MPLTPEANLVEDVSILFPFVACRDNLLNKLLSLNVAHTVNACNTVTVLDPSASNLFSVYVLNVSPYPTESTRPVSDKEASSCTPRMRCSRMEETSVGEAFVSAA